MTKILYVFAQRTLFSDTETYSSNDLKKCGLYKYWDADDAKIILLAYAFDNDPVTVIDILQGEKVPQEFLDGLMDPKVIKRAFNAAFERQAYYKHFNIYCDPNEWRCTMVLGTSLGLPASLLMQARVLNMPLQKLGDIGKDGIKTFCIPIKKPLKKHGYRTRNYPHHFPEKWEGFKAYNQRDVEAERELYCRLAKYDQPCLWPLWALDQRINDRGVMVDMELVNNAIKINDVIKAELIDEARKITGLSNPNSVQQLIEWLNDAEDQEDKQRALIEADGDDVDVEAKITDLRKKTVIELLGTVKSPTALRVLKLRQLMAKSSISKYRAMQRSVCRDGRIRGLLQFYGAARTGRWAGRIVQVQNLPQNHLVDLELARSLVKSGDIGTLKLLWGEAILQVLSELIRTAFIPAPGKRFISVDYSAIEARLGAWDAQEEWRLEVFRTHGLIYEATASRMFKVPLELIKKGGSRSAELRPKGKVTDLACLYQGAENALINMGALEGQNAMERHELGPAVKLWRKESPKVVNNWYRTQDNAVDSITYKRVMREERYGFEYRSNTLFQVLPSGRKLAYPNARIEFDQKFGRDAIVFDGIDQYTHQWKTQKTYGGKIFQNRNQANGVDLIGNSMMTIEGEGIPIVFSVHDENLVEVDESWMAAPSVKNPKKSEGCVYIEELMCRPHPAFPGLPLAADGADLIFYQK